MTLFVATGLLVAGVLAADFTRLREASPPLPHAASIDASPPRDARSTVLPRATLAELAIFGTARANAASETPPHESAAASDTLPMSRGGLELFGVLLAPTPGQSMALLAVRGGGTQMRVRTGETAPDGTRVAAIGMRGVILERDGGREWLPLPVDTASTGAAPTVRTRFMPRPALRIPAARPGSRAAVPAQASQEPGPALGNPSS